MAREQKYDVKISTQAFRDLNTHFYFLAEVSKDAANRLKSTLLTDMRLLKTIPDRNPPYERRGVTPGKYRYKLSARRYRIVFHIDGNIVRVSGIEDCRQDDGSIQD